MSNRPNILLFMTDEHDAATCGCDNAPGEWHNLAYEPEHATRIERMHRSLVEELGEEPNQTELRARAELDHGYRD